MKVMFVVATDLSANNSAVMCHNAYIRGMVEAGHIVSVITVNDTAKQIDGNIEGVEYYRYSDENFIVSRIRKNRVESQAPVSSNVTTNRKTLSSRIKLLAYKIGIACFGAEKTLRRRANRFKSEIIYDAVISLASPANSHVIAHDLIKRGRIKCKHSCQIWEDPWAMDLYGGYNEKIKKKEEKILAFAEKVLYVTPMTMCNQQKLFKTNAEKMDWLPLPSYFEDSSGYSLDDGKITYGYFGQYYPNVRNLEPFYKATVLKGKYVIICGDPSNLFESTDKIQIYPRVSIEELNEFDKKTDVLVCLANLGGGQIPGKIYQYSASVKPILFILDGNEEEKGILREYFSQFERYAFCDNTVESICNAMVEIEKEYKQYSPIEYFTAKNIANEILSKINS